ncbi:MAG: glycosyltransferase family 2 protein [Chlamydiae bacterium]|nr:glycosyltransferase family 2 protein [Chlamydiota bacterium]
MKPLISILIPVYNAEKWLSETLRSAVDQTWSRKEIIIVDNNSMDQSLAIAKNFESPLVKVITQPKRGAAAARNHALREAQGDFIQYLDADDILAPDKIEIQVRRLLSERSETIATSSWSRFYNNIHTSRFEQYPDYRDYSSPIDWLLQSWNGNGTVPLFSWVFPRTVIDRCGLWNEDLSLNDDMEYVTRALLKSSNIAFCPMARGYYRSDWGNGLSARRDRTALESYYLACKLCTQQLLAFENSYSTRRACSDLWQYFAYRVYPDALDLAHSAEFIAKSFGKTNLKLKGSKTFKFLAKLFHWKFAKRIQRVYSRYRYV